MQASETKNETLIELALFKDEATEMLVHDLKNPLAVIISNYEYILEGFDGPSDCRDALRDSQNAGLRMVRLMANLLDVKRFESGALKVRPRTMLLGDLLQPIIHQRRIIARARAVTIELTGAFSASLSVDDDLITRAVENILDNAIRYTPDGGRIEVDVTQDDLGIEVRLGNSGPPIPEDMREAIFEKNRQLGENGRMNLGLGLYFCRLAIEANGGLIWVEESEMLPVVFAIRLPHPAAHATRNPSLAAVALPA